MTTSCPYCRAGLAPKEAQTGCPSCGAPHHVECWTENDGCAVPGCESSPRRLSLTPASDVPAALAVPAGAQPTPAMAAAAAPMQAPAPTRRGRGRVLATMIVLIVALAAAGAAVALVVATPKTPVDDSPGRIQPATAQVPPPTPGGSSGTGARDASEMTEAEVAAGAEDVLNRHHELLKEAAGNPDDPSARKAYGLLSSDKRAAETEEARANGYGSGFSWWIAKRRSENLRIGQAVTIPASSVSVEDWDSDAAVAFVCADFGSYAGRTWVLYENGKWTYDAGYGHKPEREAQYGTGYGLFSGGGAC